MKKRTLEKIEDNRLYSLTDVKFKFHLFKKLHQHQLLKVLAQDVVPYEKISGVFVFKGRDIKKALESGALDAYFEV